MLYSARFDIEGGENSDITADDVICMLTQSVCDHTYRNDACGKCDKNPDKLEYGSSYKDCTGKCYDNGRAVTVTSSPLIFIHN